MALEQRKQRAPLKADKKSQPGPAARAVAIPDKLYFRIGEVSQLCGLPAHVLRFWETEFPQLKPNKGGSGQRLYRRQDVELVLELQHLLHEEKFTIAGARRLLAERRRSRATANTRAAERIALSQTAPDLLTMRGELRAILGILDGKITHSSPRQHAQNFGTSSKAHLEAKTAGKRSRRPIDDSTPLLF